MNGAPDMPALEFAAVTKRYGSVVAVDDVSFRIARGTLVTLLGPSGCGKTSTLRLIAGLEHANSGAIRIDGRDVTRLAASDRQISMVFQSYALFPHMNVLENVCYGLQATRVPRQRARDLAMAKLAQVGLAGFEARLPSELSGGQQQRVAVARAIVLEPKVLLFDEPLSNLDARLRRRVRADIRSLQQSLALTVVYVTHDREEALAVSDRVIVMNHGRIAQDGPPHSLYQQPASAFVAEFIGDANVIPVEIEAEEGRQATIRIGDVTTTVRGTGLGERSAALAVPPHALRLSARPPLSGELRGVLRKAAYLGDHMEYEIDVAGLPSDLFARSTDVTNALAPGSELAIGFDSAAVTLVPRT